MTRFLKLLRYFETIRLLVEPCLTCFERMLSPGCLPKIATWRGLGWAAWQA